MEETMTIIETLLFSAAGMTTGHLLYHGLIRKKWIDGLAIGIISSVLYIILSLIFFKSYTGLCRSCFAKGVRTEIHCRTIPEKWECKDCRNNP
jgi:tetrahydromethanopterin S-methyltransferase subunit F